ncbi:MAG: Holliday junction branch migration protein RuvA [Candidatus Latescibacteria bacterium]|nr:Holliday junction branch migration protein RuvA [Candidatus Latescibacterota bacterium]
MITYLRGKLIQKTPTEAVVEVGGIGFGAAISVVTYDQLPEVGTEVQLASRLYARDEQGSIRLDLYAFAQEREREVFELLIGVSGIGPSSALAILSSAPWQDLLETIFHQRTGELTAIKGIGKKTAERMVLELKDKIQLGDLQAAEGASAEESGKNQAADEATKALVALGYTAPGARQAVSKVLAKNGSEQSVQQLIRLALRER